MAKNIQSQIRYSIVIPVFNEVDLIDEICQRMQSVMDPLKEPYEIIFIDDGSRDHTSKKLEAWTLRHPSIRLLRFSRNFGHQIAISAGLDYAEGQAIVIIDGDLQDPPEVIPAMIDKWKEGFDVVYGKRTKRKGETLFKKITAKTFYRFLNIMTDVPIPTDVGDFRLMDRKVCDVMTSMREKHRFVRGLVSWVGFAQTSVEYEREARFAGETKYPFSKMLRFSLDAITSFSEKPLELAIYLGFLSSVSGFVYASMVWYQRLFTNKTIPGWSSSVMISLFFNGIILIVLGIIGTYIGRIYNETKGRPLYIIKDKQGFPH